MLGLQLPITPAQILWVNMVTAVTLALALACEPAERDIMRRPPRDPRQAMLTPFMLWRVAFVSILLVAGCLGLFLWEIERGASMALARTVAVHVLVLGEAAYLFNCRYLTASALSFNGLFGSYKVLIAVLVLLGVQLLFTYWPPMQTLFGTAALDAAAWLRVLLFGVAVFFIVELEKATVRRVLRDERRMTISASNARSATLRKTKYRRTKPCSTPTTTGEITCYVI